MNFGERIRNLINPPKGYGVRSLENGVVAMGLTRAEAVKLAKDKLTVPEKSKPRQPERDINEMLVR